jgi:hypothetical protein
VSRRPRARARSISLSISAFDHPLGMFSSL